jgi:hypothetical protein
MPRKFNEAFGMLTPMGMRQRYFMGRYLKERYAADIDFSKDLYIRSTDFYRTI